MGRRAMISCAALTLAVAVGGCRDAQSSQAQSPPATVLVLAAASTSDAMTEVAGAYEERTGVSVRLTTGGSNALARQVIAGAPGDVFLSANPRWAEALHDEGMALEMRPLLSNRLVIVTPIGNPAQVHTPRDLMGATVRRIALAGEQVPAGMYAQQALRAAGLYDTLTDGGRVARGQDVRLTLAWVETGEAEAGVVYATDAAASTAVEIVYTFPADAHDPIVYPLVLLSTGDSPDAGRGFFEYLLGEEAQAVFARHGFTPLPTGAVVAP